MSVPIDKVTEVLRDCFKGAIVSSVQASQELDPRSYAMMDVYKWECTNQSRLTAPFPFGFFASIKPKNDVKSELVVMTAPGFPDNVVFPAVCVRNTSATGELSEFTQCTQMVQVGSIAPVGLAIWMCKHEPVDETHMVRTVIKDVVLANNNSQLAYVERVVGNTTASVTNSFAVADAGLDVIKSEVKPAGNGQYIKETTRPAAGIWPEMAGSTWDPELKTQVKTLEKFVAPPEETNFEEKNTSYEIVNKDRSLRRVKVVPTEALNSYFLRFPVRVSLDLPRVLKSVNVIWNGQYSIGTQDTWAYETSTGDSGSISLDIPDRASSSASISAELQIEYEDFAANNLFADRVTFFIHAPATQETICARIQELLESATAVTMWPVFKPKSSTIVVYGQSIQVAVNVKVAMARSWGPDRESFSSSNTASDDFAAGITGGAVQIPPCIHPAITITGDTTRSQGVSATASMSIAGTAGGSVSATKTKSGTAFGSVSPAIIPGCSGRQTIPTNGLFVLDMSVANSEYDGYYMVRADVFNANVFAEYE